MRLTGDWRAGVRPGLYIGAALALFLLGKLPAFPDAGPWEMAAWVGISLAGPIALFVGLYALGILKPRAPSKQGRSDA